MGGLAVFDLDGTLVDTAPDLIDTANVVLGRVGVPAAPDDKVRPAISFGARAMIGAVLAAGGATLSEAEIDGLHADFLTEYTSRIARLSRPFPEILDALDRLEQADVTLAVCTNKLEGLASELLDSLGLLSRFVTVAGRDTFAYSKPDPRHLLLTIERAGGASAQTVFVGDSAVDRETARAAGVPMVGLTYGYTDVPMAELQPERALGRGEDIGEAILSLLAPRAAA
ncbi:HAD-IA family hydrolase [Acuticoccus mangrovi]|uniref:Phosphoglycolate phosphatase n=1 Tax=Acuticoccus mangrovi TaxID=2796142 RepID=A0A934MFP3_9HYPH|nr:HAD-IA family hydrolase [Acuticoccus mangrovi]MBJ3774101.1 HAD-IA family hydrolase [Acuticoccus mangrovi]